MIDLHVALLIHIKVTLVALRTGLTNIGAK